MQIIFSICVVILLAIIGLVVAEAPPFIGFFALLGAIACCVRFCRTQD